LSAFHSSGRRFKDRAARPIRCDRQSVGNLAHRACRTFPTKPHSFPVSSQKDVTVANSRSARGLRSVTCKALIGRYDSYAMDVSERGT
jgi:hypothetical protein